MLKLSFSRGAILMTALFLSVPAHAQLSSNDIGKGTFGLGLNYPGLGLKYFLSNNYALEVKGQAQNGDDVGGLRAYRYFRPASRIFLFVGLEGDYVRFKGAVSKGTGYGGEVFGGAEYFITSHVGVQADFGPAYVYLKDTSSSLSANGIEYVMNIGINYYFGHGSDPSGQAVERKERRRGEPTQTMAIKENWIDAPDHQEPVKARPKQEANQTQEGGWQDTTLIR